MDLVWNLICDFLQDGRELVAAGIGYTLTYPENLQTPILEDTGEDPAFDFGTGGLSL